MPRRVERLGEGEVLFGNDSSRYALRLLAAVNGVARNHVRTDLNRAVMNLSVSSGFMRPRTSRTPMANLGMTVACSVNVSSKILQ
jgi:hypothetical protein